MKFVEHLEHDSWDFNKCSVRKNQVHLTWIKRQLLTAELFYVMECYDCQTYIIVFAKHIQYQIILTNSLLLNLILNIICYFQLP